MSDTQSLMFSGFKYVYIIAFFTLLAGFFHPIITGASFDGVLGGVFVLLLGLGGGILVYKAATSHKKRGMFFGGGFALMGLSLLLIFYATGRV